MFNVTASSITFANDLTALLPKYINFRLGQFIGAVVGFAICAWQTHNQTTAFPEFMVVYPPVLSGNTCAMVSDYFLVGQGCGIDISHLFKPHRICSHDYGVNCR
ncbi:hypothetical protein AYL99_11849 [Fonsecaea erecta]|uniref:Uncharacterized protein n=1 Tax=Fonsecaea erecta TaxID=1367422 RepID=A0A178Z2E5_9EURO|nr:hypothetical protein AYL99_11849 [Fonsecaea erecta]OAP53969.1 hypothetical protein AYL99_11849 [Fonsecaea erecta]